MWPPDVLGTKVTQTLRNYFAENNVGPDGEVFEVVKEMKIMFMMPNKIFTGVCTSNTKHGERRPAGCPPDPRVSGLDSQNDKRRDDRLREDHVGQFHDLFRDKTKYANAEHLAKASTSLVWECEVARQGFVRLVADFTPARQSWHSLRTRKEF